MRKIVSCSMLALSLCWAQASAEEGFWLERQLEPDSTVLRELAAVKHAVPRSLPLQHLQQLTGRIGDCSTAFVSENGLLLTSDHCIAAYLGGTAETAFVPGSDSDELPIPGLELYLLQHTQDVTVTINRQLSAETTVKARSDKLQQLKTALVTDCQQQSALHCELTSLHHGLEFYLVQYKVLRDLRLVYRPAKATVATDSNWPRYGADYVLLRAYVDSNGAAASYAADNKPYHSAFARLSAQGVAEHELVLTPGFSPGSRRYATAAEVSFNFERLFPRSVEYLQQAVALIEQLAPEGSERAVQYAATLAELKQEVNKIQALLAHYQRSSLMQVKQQRRQTVLDWINSSPVRQQLYGPVLDRLQLVLSRQQDAAQRDLVLGYLKYAQLPALATQLYKLALQPDKQRTALLRQQLDSMDKRFDARVDMELALHFLEQYSQLPKEQRLAALDQYFALSDGFNREIVRHKLSAMYRGTVLTNPEQRAAWLARSAEQFQHSTDPLISFAVAMYDTAKQLAAERVQLQVELDSVRAALMEVLIAFNDARGKATYADANGALRFSLGRVSGYQPMDAVWHQPFSSLTGYLQTQSSTDTAAMPAGAPQLPVNFLSSTDSCSDYGGAPTFNTKGELVGIMYSGVQENLLADWHYDADL
ncbi:MAG TPA: S46 family peptidase, partial [Rheinheimera sp.]|nr:S46 family peptidase [Rheinheimera sp.]